MTRPKPIPPDEARADFAALRRRGINLTPAIRATLEKAILYQDISRDEWAAHIIDRAPPGVDPVQEVRDTLAEMLRLRIGGARFEERRIKELIAQERAFMGGDDLEDRSRTVYRRHAERLEGEEEMARDRDRM